MNKREKKSKRNRKQIKSSNTKKNNQNSNNQITLSNISNQCQVKFLLFHLLTIDIVNNTVSDFCTVEDRKNHWTEHSASLVDIIRMSIEHRARFSMSREPIQISPKYCHQNQHFISNPHIDSSSDRSNKSGITWIFRQHSIKKARDFTGKPLDFVWITLIFPNFCEQYLIENVATSKLKVIFRTTRKKLRLFGATDCMRLNILDFTRFSRLKLWGF